MATCFCTFPDTLPVIRKAETNKEGAGLNIHKVLIINAKGIIAPWKVFSLTNFR